MKFNISSFVCDDVSAVEGGFLTGLLDAAHTLQREKNILRFNQSEQEHFLSSELTVRNIDAISLVECRILIQDMLESMSLAQKMIFTRLPAFEKKMLGVDLYYYMVNAEIYTNRWSSSIVKNYLEKYRPTIQIRLFRNESHPNPSIYVSTNISGTAA